MERSSTFSSHTASSHTAPPQAHPERPSAAQLFGAAQDRAAHPSGGHGLLGSIFLKMAEVDQEEQAVWQGYVLPITEALRPMVEHPFLLSSHPTRLQAYQGDWRRYAAQVFYALQDPGARLSENHCLLGSLYLKMAEVDQEEQALWQGRFLRITEALRPAAEAPPSSASTSRILQEELRSPAAQRPGTVRDRGARRAGNHCLLNSLFLTMGEVDQEEQAFWQGHVLPVAEALRPL